MVWVGIYIYILVYDVRLCMRVRWTTRVCACAREREHVKIDMCIVFHQAPSVGRTTSIDGRSWFNSSIL